MSASRRDLVGKGYMPKGGARAAARHNADVRARIDSSDTDGGDVVARSDGRASDRSAWWHGFAVGSVGSTVSSIAACWVWLR